jgi:hypothetical protein
MILSGREKAAYTAEVPPPPHTLAKGRAKKKESRLSNENMLDANVTRTRMLSRRGFLQGSGAVFALSFVNFAGCPQQEEVTTPGGSLTAFPEYSD